MAKQTRVRTTRSRVNLRLRRIVIAVVVVALLGVTIYEVRTLRRNPIRTTTALDETVCDSVNAEVFVLRDEQVVQSDLTGYTVLFVQDGERVESNARIAARFADAGSAQRYATLMDLRVEYDRYEELSTGREYSSMKVQALIQKSADRMCSFLQAADGGNVAEAKALESDFLGQETALEIAVSGNLDLSSRLNDLSQKIRAQEAAVGEYDAITTGVESGGYFYGCTDGCEDILSYDQADQLTVEQIEAALREKPGQADGSKIVKSYVWYVAAVVDAQTADKLTNLKKGTVRLAFPKAGVSDVRATVYALNPQSDGKCAAVFRCVDVSADLLRLRRTEAQIILGEVTGFKVPIQAVRMLDMDVYDENGKLVLNEDGTPMQQKTRCVFVLRGNVVTQRRLDIAYTGEDYVLTVTPDRVADPSKAGTYVKRYDEIITGGKNLYAGAVIYE